MIIEIATATDCMSEGYVRRIRHLATFADLFEIVERELPRDLGDSVVDSHER